MIAHFVIVTLALWLAFIVIRALRPGSIFKHRALQPIPLRISVRDIDEEEMEERKARSAYMGHYERGNKTIDIWVEK